jgi:hypothetical protein
MAGTPAARHSGIDSMSRNGSHISTILDTTGTIRRIAPDSPPENHFVSAEKTAPDCVLLGEGGIGPPIRSHSMTLASRIAAILSASAFLAATAAAGEARVFSDDFSSTGSGWQHTPVADHTAKGFSAYDGSGGYQMTPLDDVTLGVSLSPRQAGSGNVRIQADLFLYTGVGAGIGGVVCRHSAGDNYYGFMVSGAHGYAIIKVNGGHPQTLVSGKFEGMMPNIADVSIEAICDGNTLRMSLGGEVVAEISDSAFGSGASGLMVMGEKTAGTSAVFDSFTLSELSAR